jgi:hypothetical protein
MQIQDSGTSHLQCLILIGLYVLVCCVISRYSQWFLKEHKLQVQTPPTYEVVEFQKVWSKLNFVLVRIEWMYGQLLYICLHKRVKLKSKFQHTGTWLATL